MAQDSALPKAAFVASQTWPPMYRNDFNASSCRTMISWSVLKFRKRYRLT